jgi:hypothetical protein
MLDHLDRNQPAESAGGKVPAPGVAIFFDVWRPATDCLEAWSKTAHRTQDELARNWLKFVDDRLAKDSAIPQRLTSCRNMEELFSFYVQYWQQTASDYTREFSSMADVGWRAARSVVASTESPRRGGKAN